MMQKYGMHLASNVLYVILRGYGLPFKDLIDFKPNIASNFKEQILT